MSRFDYLLVLPTSPNIKTYVSRKKKLVKRLIGNFDSMNSIAHLTIANFFNKPDYKIEPLIPSLRQKILTLPPIYLRVNGFDYFENPKSKTIYLKPIIEQHEMNWFDQISDHVNKSNIVPHITIAKGISDDQFEILWPIFKDEEFFDSFVVNHLMILKRDTYGPDNYYEDFKTLRFKNNRLVMPFICKSRKKRTQFRNGGSDLQTLLFL